MPKINKNLLPVKAHYFFFMAAMGPILPQITVFGKELGIPPDIMGLITSVLPILYVLAKPAFGFLADYFTNYRKHIFILLILIMTLSYAGFYFVPHPASHSITLDFKFNITLQASDVLKTCDLLEIEHSELCTTVRKVDCSYSQDSKFEAFLLSGKENWTNSFEEVQLCLTSEQRQHKRIGKLLNVTCVPNIADVPDCLYNTATFWSFVILMCVGTIGFNVGNSISDAICFDVLGDSQEMKYGGQRVFGTIGFGVTALLAGIAVDLGSNSAVKSFTPALIVMLIFSGIDLISITKLKLPKLSSSESILSDVGTLLRRFPIVLFLVFATFAGIIDSFIIYYMFWHLEEVAAKTGYMEQIKLIEGCVVAAECLGGEILFFLMSGKILKKIGYVHCLSLCFFNYSIRLALISLIPNPWWLVPIEFFMQGCTYALCYTTIVAYAAAIAPLGTSATIQGLVAGIDDGLGFAIGSLVGGQMYKFLGGTVSFRIFSVGAFIVCIAHIFLRPASIHETQRPASKAYGLPLEQNIDSPVIS